MLNRTAIIKQPDNISSFNDVYKLQKEYQEALILDNSNPDFIWIGEHQLCYTLGRGSNYDNLLFSLNDAKYDVFKIDRGGEVCLLYTSPSPRDATLSRMPSSA